MHEECLDAETLAAYVDGLLVSGAITRADRHIDRCRECRRELSALAATATVASFPNGSASFDVPLDDVQFTIGETLGRYRVQGELGRGNMGVVVRAWDPELARHVAIKILAPKWAGGAGAQERLRREAQAMARLSHPNVVQVYDVTSQSESVAIAMELVDGKTLRDAIASGATWRELLAICVSAGRGLAAAHAAKLIHRDYKPENVLVAFDGRVVVSDFGLARVDEMPAIPHDAAPVKTSLAGTPAYLAPELWRHEPATIASDQFSYCVATYEALYGERPFAGDTLAELHANASAGTVRAAPAGSKVPLAIRAALVRGLSPHPSERFASMTDLVDTLGALGPLGAIGAPRAKRRYAIAGGALAAIAIAGGIVLAMRPSESMTSIARPLVARAPAPPIADDARRAAELFNLSLAYERVDVAKASALLDEVVALSSQPGRETWRTLAHALDAQAKLAEEREDITGALALRERARAALDRDDDPTLRAWIDLELGRVLRSSKQIAKSIAPLERAVAFHERDASDRYRAALAKFWLAKSLWETKTNRARAKALATSARADADAAPAGFNLELHRAQIADWVAKH